MCIPYVYKIGWTKLDTWYIGCQYSKNCSPTDLWKTYFTSSKHVKKFRKLYGEPDHIEILKIFDNIKDSQLYETQLLIENNIIDNKNWLNRNISGNYYFNHIGCMHSEETKRKISLAMKGKKHSEETKRKIAMKKLGVKRKPFTQTALDNMSITHSGKRNGMFGKKHSEETKRKISETKQRNLKNIK